MNYANLLFGLRDGRPGLIQRTRWQEVPLPGRRVMKVRAGIIEALVLPISKRAKIPAALKTKEWLIRGRVLPQPKLWEQFKRARSPQHVLAFARSIRRPLREFYFSSKFVEPLLRTLRSHAQSLVEVKRLPNYPRAKRPRSDDKRIEFLAKVLAGLTLGIAPLTATKKLSHFRLPKGSIERAINEFVGSVQKQKGARQ